MQLAVVLGLVFLWAIVLLPDVLRRTTTRKSHDSISSFNHHLSVLERSNPATPRQGNVFPLVPRGQAQVAPASRPQHQPVRGIGFPEPQSQPQVAPAAPRPQAAPVAAGRHAPAGAVRPARPAVPGAMTSAQAQRRRQDVITGLAALSLLSLLATLTFGAPMLYLHLLIDVAFVVYLALALATTRRQKVRSTVHYLPPQAQSVRADYRDVVRSSVGR